MRHQDTVLKTVWGRNRKEIPLENSKNYIFSKGNRPIYLDWTPWLLSWGLLVFLYFLFIFQCSSTFLSIAVFTQRGLSSDIRVASPSLVGLPWPHLELWCLDIFAKGVPEVKNCLFPYITILPSSRPQFKDFFSWGLTFCFLIHYTLGLSLLCNGHFTTRVPLINVTTFKCQIQCKFPEERRCLSLWCIFSVYGTDLFILWELKYCFLSEK